MSEKQSAARPAPASPQEELPLSPHWAFVVQFRVGADIEQGPCRGQVEHVVSGQAAHFQSVAELLAFIARVLTTVRSPLQKTRTGAAGKSTVRRRAGAKGGDVL